MKNLTVCATSPFLYIFLTVLFLMPYVGFPALLFCAIFVRNDAVRSYARAWLIVELLVYVAIIALVVLWLNGAVELPSELIEEYMQFSEDSSQVFGGAFKYLGA